jgi:hypothetical protein
MHFSHAPPCLFLGITIDTKETRNTIACASIFGAKLRIEKRQKFLFILDFSDNSIGLPTLLVLPTGAALLTCMLGFQVFGCV